MNSLRNRIVGLLILAIVTVVALATFVASRVLQPPSAEMTVAATVAQLRISRELVSHSRDDAVRAGVVLKNAPPSGRRDDRLSEALDRALKKDGIDAEGFVTMPSGKDDGSTAAIKLAEGEWLFAALPNHGPPPDGWLVLGGWMTLIILGSTAVSIFAASKIIGPLELLQSAAGRIGTDGVLPYIPETGAGEVRATAQALNRLSARLRSAMESRMRLVAAAGHDLRTPMTRMRLRAEFVTDDDEREKWLSDLEELDAIADSAIRLVREEVASPGVTETVHLNELVADIVTELQQLGFKAETTGLDETVARGAPLALKRAVRNLVINAATHGGGASVSVRNRDGKAVIVISDNGPGIPPDRLGQIFEPFFRVDSARRKTLPGAGLGLAIAKEIVERFGGTIEVANSNPSGLVQTVKLDLH
ncbi:HAMP domain-containing protein (plasmid) [Rhizobium grahamii]|uniref:histidine kinase n=1 Tax=Rhizobium grahamii TaxID=1120045 RepID=A0A5Q0CHA4_9HYPH|nr:MULTISPECIES: ATP-binding protein [Rhizobium]QFY63840.1 HAMP domain-containing protein [Rhizobium grahamii]QRM52916.1 HAMP domain-containing protein [Rhizobium sp. BG6]